MLNERTMGEVLRETARTFPEQEAYVYPELGIRKSASGCRSENY